MGSLSDRTRPDRSDGGRPHGRSRILGDRPRGELPPGPAYRKNASTLAMVDAWADALVSVGGDDYVRVVVVTGSADSFCAGVDLDDFNGETRDPLGEKALLTGAGAPGGTRARGSRQAGPGRHPWTGDRSRPRHGPALRPALHCALRPISEAYIKVGLVPGDGGCWLLPRVVGTSRALHMLWTGEMIDATDALAIGLIDQVHDDVDLPDAVTAYARDLAARPPVAGRRSPSR